MFLEVVLLIFTLILFAYGYLQWKWTYWAKKGVYALPPTFPLGSMPSFFTKSKHLNDELLSHVEKTKNLPFYGIYFNALTILMVNDADIAKNILVKDFDFFIDRNGQFVLDMFETKHKCDIIFCNQMSNSTGELWKNLRSTFSPIFTSGKMKAMMVFIQETSSNMLQAIDKCAKSNEDFELKSILGKYSMDTIASCAFGVDAESFTNDDSKFVLYASNIFQQTKTDALKMLTAMIPGGKALINALNIAMFKETETEFFYEAVVSSLRHRRETQTRRNDLIDLMLDAIKGDISEDHHAEEDDQFEKVKKKCCVYC